MTQVDQTAHITRHAPYKHTPLDENDQPRLDSNKQVVVDTYLLSKIDISSLTELEDYLRGEPLDMIAPRVLNKPPMMQEQMIAAALTLGDKRRIGTQEFDRAVQSTSGVMYLLYLSLRQKHPGITPSQASRIFVEATKVGEQQIKELTNSLFRVTGFTTGKTLAGDNQATPPALINQ